MYNTIKRIALCSLFAAAIAGGGVASAEQSGSESEWINLFNGKNLDGWAGSPEIWRVVDGHIEGKGPSTYKQYLSNTNHVFKNFILEAKFFPVKGNSGINYRSHEYTGENRPYETSGYQCDIGPMGALYDINTTSTSKRYKLVRDDFNHLVDMKGWNTFRIVADGKKLQHFINGTLVMEFEDNDPEGFREKGFIALEYHDKNVTVWFKEIRVKRLPATQDAPLRSENSVETEKNPSNNLLNPSGSQAPDYAVQHWEQEYAELQHEIEKRDDKKALPEKSVSPSNILNRHSLIWDTDRDALDVVLRRTRALLEHIKAMSNAPDLVESEKELTQLETASRQTDLANPPATDAQRLVLFKAARALQRQVALANPILNDIDEILFSKGDGYEGLLQTAPWGQIKSVLGRDWTKEDWETYNFKTPEGEKKPDTIKRPGLFVLSGFKTGTPETRPLFMDSKIENGPNAGKLLVNFPGNYQFNFDLSYDGKSVVFAKCLGDRTSYHIFKGNVDGSGLRQLTHSWFPDWDPCFLPNGRIAFISLRRWISARCQSWKPQACGTLFSMKADGSDLYPISWHETSEFFPTVNNDGMLVYTRWDYIDRDFNGGQHLWTCAPDGRDPRAPHGNYTQPFSTQDETQVLSGELFERPWAEFHIRAIPNTSGKYIGIAGIHHGSTPGVPILINTSIKDDNALSQVKILRGNSLPREEPRGRGPEARYSTPWPLSEDYFLATIYAEAGILSPMNPRILYKSQGIVLMDKFGNTEMLMAGKGISARPLKSRETPPEIPAATWQGERKGAADHKRATISIMNIYEADLPFPEGTEITDLRIIQVVQKPWSSDIIQRKTMGYSYGGMARMILGTVPVEKDGSAYFEAPVEREIYFQALDSQGMAVQSMRTATYVHPGEQLSCIGCHEDKTSAPSMTAAPMAMMRPPSKITPEKVPGAAPFSFARLVQPVLENSCLPCHNKEETGFRSSNYADLEEFAFYFDGDGGSLGLYPKHGGYRTTPGRFGARESRMGKALLNDTHQKAMQAGDISPDDFHRIVLWLDANSMELGSYHDDEAQREGKVIWPVLEADPANPSGVEHDRPLP